MLWGEKYVSQEDGPGPRDVAGRDAFRRTSGHSPSDFDKFGSTGDGENREKHPQASDPADLI